MEVSTLSFENSSSKPVTSTVNFLKNQNASFLVLPGETDPAEAPFYALLFMKTRTNRPRPKDNSRFHRPPALTQRPKVGKLNQSNDPLVVMQFGPQI